MKRYLNGAREISAVQAGLHTTGLLKQSPATERRAAAVGSEVLALDRYTRQGSDPGGVLFGFAAFDEETIRHAVIRLARALGRGNS